MYLHRPVKADEHKSLTLPPTNMEVQQGPLQEESRFFIGVWWEGKGPDRIWVP